MATNPNQQDPTVVTDAEWAQMQREAQGDSYPGDAEMQRQREEFIQEFEARNAAEAPAQPSAEAPAAASQPAEWNAREWLNATFKDDPGFKDLSEADMARLEALANQKREEFADDIREWGTEKSSEWTGEMKDAIRDGLGSNPDTQGFFESRLADGDMSAEDKAELEALTKDMSPQDAARVIHPIAEELHEIQGELIDGVEMITGHAIDDISEIVDARAEMPGGDHESIQKMQQDLEEAPEKIHDALNWEREQAEREWGKVEDRLELIEAGTDPNDIPPDPDTYQVDPNADSLEDGTEVA